MLFQRITCSMQCSLYINRAVWVKNDFSDMKKNKENKIIIICRALWYAICTPPHISSLHRLHVIKCTTSDLITILKIVILSTWTNRNPRLHEPQCSGFQPLMTDHLITNVLTFMTGSNVTGEDHALVSWLPPLSCYCWDHSWLEQALSFIKWGWLFLCFMEWDTP